MTTNAANEDAVVDKTLQARWKRFYSKKSNKFAFWGVLILVLVLVFGPMIKSKFFGGDADAQVVADSTKAAGQPTTLTQAEVDKQIARALAKQDSTNNAQKMAVAPTQAQQIQQGVVMAPDSAMEYSIRWSDGTWEYGVAYQLRAK